MGTDHAVRLRRPSLTASEDAERQHAHSAPTVRALFACADDGTHPVPRSHGSTNSPRPHLGAGVLMTTPQPDQPLYQGPLTTAPHTPMELRNSMHTIGGATGLNGMLMTSSPARLYQGPALTMPQGPPATLAHHPRVLSQPGSRTQGRTLAGQPLLLRVPGGAATPQSPSPWAVAGPAIGTNSGTLMPLTRSPYPMPPAYREARNYAPFTDVYLAVCYNNAPANTYWKHGYMSGRANTPTPQMGALYGAQQH